jgi:hypothetical protein
MGIYTVRYLQDDGVIRDDGNLIDYEGKLWLVPEWLAGPTSGTRCPARIICTSSLGLTKAPAGSVFEYLLERPLHRDVVEGRKVTQTPYVKPRPEITLRVGTDFLPK